MYEELIGKSKEGITKYREQNCELKIECDKKLKSQSNTLSKLTTNYQNLEEATEFIEDMEDKMITLKVNESVHEQDGYNKLQIESKNKTYGLKQSSTNNNNNSDNEYFNLRYKIGHQNVPIIFDKCLELVNIIICRCRWKTQYLFPLTYQLLFNAINKFEILLTLVNVNVLHKIFSHSANEINKITNYLCDELFVAKFITLFKSHFTSLSKACI